MPTPAESIPAAVGVVVRQLADEFGWPGFIGCAFPGPVIDGVVRTAVNLDASWVGAHASNEFAVTLGRDVTLVNDADATGIAEMRLGAGIGRRWVDPGSDRPHSSNGPPTVDDERGAGNE